MIGDDENAGAHAAGANAIDPPSVSSERTGRWHQQFVTLRAEARGSLELRGALTAVGTLAIARTSGATLRQATALGLVAGLARRDLLDARYQALREIRNSADAATLAAWLGDRIPPLGAWAIEPDFGRLIAEQLMHGPETVVECGSGTTTLLIGGFLRRNGRGRLFSLEHDARFAESTRRQVEAAGLSDVCKVICAPLKQQAFRGEIVRWYDQSQLLGLPEAIDLLVVDGPPAEELWARWPALEVFGERLRPSGAILVDDGRREQERRTVYRWLASRRDLELYWHDTIKGSWRLVKSDESSPTPLRQRYRTARRLVNPHPQGFGRWAVKR